MTGQQYILEPKYVTGIDIGTNTILMSIAKIHENNFEILEDFHEIARLGEGVDSTKIINNNAIERAKNILLKYRNILDNYSDIEIIACGTSALRDAENSNEVVEILSSIIGSKIKVISGETEAELSYLGAIESSERCLMIDIGGGSTEFSIGNENKILQRNSLNFGSVRLSERFITNHPPKNEEIKFIKELIFENIKNIELEKFDRVYGIAGTATTIASISLSKLDFDESEIHNLSLTHNKIKIVLEMLLSLSIEDIIMKLGVNPKRADLITTGTIILLSLLEIFKINEFTVSTKGLRTGIIKNYIKNLVNL